MRTILTALLVAAGLIGASQAGAAECKPRPLPPAIESAGLPPTDEFNNVITFAATPSLEYPRRAWVIRLFQRTRSRPATLTIVRLLRRNDCNVYDVEARWEAPVRADEYEAIATLVAPYATPSPGIFTQKDMAHDRGLAVDGTELNLRVQSLGWQVMRSLTSAHSEGTAISAIFHRLLVPIVPAPERPGEYWSMTPR